MVHAAGAGLLCPLCFTKADITAARQRTGFEGRAVALAGAVAAVIPFVVQAASAQMAGASHDWVAVAGGGVAALCGGSTMVAARARASGRWLLVGALALALGAYHLARAAGLLG